MNLFSRAAAQEYLRPFERAILTFLNTFALLLAVTALPLLLSALDTVAANGAAHVNWGDLLQTVVKMFAGSLALALRKLYTAQADNPPAGYNSAVYINPTPAPTISSTSSTTVTSEVKADDLT
jgi:hypothetical protein